ncbi:type II secretion system protein [Vibrio vulnificus]|uniref:type II secretion system protein n=1 Tax=Vibrio vulnificus TaxID=672 RepID=UPI00307FCF30
MKNKGFTLIELVVVIFVLGILAVTAMPRFLNLQSDSRKATLAAAKGTLESAFQIFSAKSQVPSADIKLNDKGEKTLTLNGFEFGLTDDFYPILPIFPSINSLEPLLSIVNLDLSLDDKSDGLIYTWDHNGGIILHYGITDFRDSRCFISYAPDKFHNNDISSHSRTDGYFYVLDDGC